MLRSFVEFIYVFGHFVSRHPFSINEFDELTGICRLVKTWKKSRKRMKRRSLRARLSVDMGILLAMHRRPTAQLTAFLRMRLM
jgi:hypothetical protein